MEGQPVSRIEDIHAALFGVVDPQFLRTAGIPILAGRDFSESDSEKAPVAAVVNQAFARRYFPDRSPIGRRIEMGTPASLNAPDPWLRNEHIQATIVGLMRDTKNNGLALPVEPQFMTLYKQTPVVNFDFKEVLVRLPMAAGPLIDEIREELHRVDPRLLLSEAMTMTEHIEDQTSDKRFATVLLSAFAALDLVLAIVGVYGVISHLMLQRQQDGLWLIAREGLMLALLGVGRGLAGTAIASHSISSFLYGVSALDVLTLGTASALLVLIALLASAVPGRRAMLINPIEALRAE